jgi:hypothetical protein
MLKQTLVQHGFHRTIDRLQIQLGLARLMMLRECALW